MKLSSSISIALTLVVGTEAFVPRFASQQSTVSISPNTQTTSALGATIEKTNGEATAIPVGDEPTVAAVPKLAARWRKKTKQLTTLGPASQNKEMIEKLFLAGADVFRLNFSHGSQEQKKELLMMIREIEEKYSHPIGILGDLQGPKLRVRFYFRICAFCPISIDVCL